MELTGIQTERSPLAPDRVRLIGRVAYDDRQARPEEYWFDVPEAYAGSLSGWGNPWLACLLPLAVTLGEPLRLCLPVDRALFVNVDELQQIWKCWYPRLSVVPVEAEAPEPETRERPDRTAAFFSGGVDSFFTVLRHGQDTGSPSRVRIDELLCVWGFDVPLENADAFRRMRGWLGKTADDLGRPLVDVATNLRTTRWQEADWAHLSHGCALASVGLALERRYGQVLIASSDDYLHLHPWGSHALTDPLLSTSRTRIRHDGAGFSRLPKTELVARSDVALQTLRVCWKSRSDENCRVCEKCWRTMLSLELFGVLDRCPTFRGARMDPAVIPRIYIKPEVVGEYRELQARALREGRKDIARAIERSFRRSARIARGLKVADYLRTKRFCWRGATRLERLLLARCLT
jgi:hypothetical protein